MIATYDFVSFCVTAAASCFYCGCKYRNYGMTGRKPRSVFAWPVEKKIWDRQGRRRASAGSRPEKLDLNVKWCNQKPIEPSFQH